MSISDFDKVVDIPIWSTRAEAFTWLAHFIDYRDAFESYAHEFVAKHKHADVASHPALNTKLLNERKLGATQLMDWLGITSAMLEQALQHQILTLAQDWCGSGCQFNKTAQKLPLWYALQRHVQAAVDWLCLANDDFPVVYLDRLRYDNFCRHEWARLQDVYEDPRWKAARLVSSEITDIAKRYSTGQRDFARDFSPSPTRLIAQTDKTNAFGSYLDALGNFLDESQYSTGDNPNRPRNRTSWYRVTAVMAEIVLEDAVGDKKIKGEKYPQAISRLLAKYDEAVCGKISSREKIRLGWEEGLKDIAERIRRSSSNEDLVENFSLAVSLARNATAHQHELDLHFLYADWAGPIFDALVLFVPWTLMQLQPAEQTESAR